ncbi:MAG: hypothetical protein K1W28_08790 [Lachnospiraceae bacterium]
MTETIVCESRLKKYGEDAFMRHREEVCAAVRTVCFCLEFLQNEENWSGRRALARERYWYSERLTPEEKEKDWEKYDSGARQKAYRKLKSALKERKWRIGGQEIPLRNFLRMGLMLLTEKAGTDGMGDEIQLMESQMEINCFQDFREFLEAVYLLGFAELFNRQRMDAGSSLEGEHRDAERFLKALEPYIPEEGQADYGLFGRELLQEQARERRKAMERIMEEREEKLTRAVEEISLFQLFREAMERMPEEEFEKLVTPDREEEDICGWEELSGDEQESIRRERRTNRIRNLASAFVYGGSRARHRLLGQFSGEEQMLVMEQWMAAYYPRDEEMLESRLGRMAWVAGLEAYSQERDRVIREAMEKLLGRPLRNDG